ncbi:MAG: hypothetical protein LBT59_15715, partial [Clostridiales bacterium]|nr:hypothetical protein [Clostridiales bacterium]
MKIPVKKLVALIMAFVLVLSTGVYCALADDDPAPASFKLDFENGNKGVASPSGDAILSVVEKSFEGSGSKSLYVSGRTKDYDAADVPLSALGAVVGDTLKIRVLGYVDTDADVPDGSLITVTLPNDYAYNGTVNLVKGQAFVIEATKEITNENSKNVRIQTNSAGATVPFYIDSIEIDVVKPGDESEETDSGEAPDPGAGESFDYAYDFEDDTLGAVVKGGNPTFTVVSKTFDGSGSKSLYVSGRTKDYDAADVPLSALGAVVGDTLKIRVLGYVDSDAEVPEGSQITVTVPDDYGYNGTVNLVKGQAFVIEATKKITN